VAAAIVDSATSICLRAWTDCVYSSGFMVQNPDKKSLVQRLAVIDHMLARFNKELGYQQSQIKKLQARTEMRNKLLHAQYHVNIKWLPILLRLCVHAGTEH